MITDAVQRAIVEILDIDKATSLGTGFLVAEGGIVLTAKHVLRNHKAVQVRFPGHEAIVATRIEGEDTGDWAIIRVESIPSDVAPVPWSPLENVASAAWVSSGYAALRALQCGGFHGTVRVATATTLDLVCPEFIGARYADARGFSGAPCVVGGEVVGLIVDVLVDWEKGAQSFESRADQRRQPLSSVDTQFDDAPIIGGQVNAIPLQVIAERTRLIPDESIELPWQKQFTGAIEELTSTLQQLAADAASVRDPVTGPRLPRRVARQMIRGRIVSTSKVIGRVIHGFRVGTTDLLMRQAQTLWVDAASAEHLAVIATTPTVGLLATEFDWSARHHFERAAEHHRMNTHGSDSWTHVLVQGVHEEPFVDSVVEEIRHALDPKGNPVRIAFRFSRERIVAFAACLPREDLVQRLRSEWPQLAVVFLSRAASSSDPTGVVRVTPGPRFEDEERAELENEYALNSVAQARSAS